MTGSAFWGSRASALSVVTRASPFSGFCGEAGASYEGVVPFESTVSRPASTSSVSTLFEFGTLVSLFVRRGEGS